MKLNSRALIFAIIVPLLQFGTRCSLNAASWEDEKRVWEELSGTKNYKDPGYAAKLSLNFLPIDNGHFYVGEVGKGIWFSVGQTMGLVAVAVPVLGSQSRSKEDLDPIWTDAMIVTAASGALSYIALKVWAGYDAAEGARRYNRQKEDELKEKQTWQLHFAPGAFSLTKRFP